jgi:hypothetical protein
MLPPDMVAEAEATSTLRETLAVPPQFVLNKHDENATPVAAAQEMVPPRGPVRFSVF